MSIPFGVVDLLDKLEQRGNERDNAKTELEYKILQNECIEIAKDCFVIAKDSPRFGAALQQISNVLYPEVDDWGKNMDALEGAERRLGCYCVEPVMFA